MPCRQAEFEKEINQAFTIGLKTEIFKGVSKLLLNKHLNLETLIREASHFERIFEDQIKLKQLRIRQEIDTMNNNLNTVEYFGNVNSTKRSEESCNIDRIEYLLAVKGQDNTVIPRIKIHRKSSIDKISRSCKFCKKPGHLTKTCFQLHPELITIFYKCSICHSIGHNERT